MCEHPSYGTFFSLLSSSLPLLSFLCIFISLLQHNTTQNPISHISFLRSPFLPPFSLIILHSLSLISLLLFPILSSYFVTISNFFFLFLFFYPIPGSCSQDLLDESILGPRLCRVSEKSSSAIVSVFLISFPLLHIFLLYLTSPRPSISLPINRTRTSFNVFFNSCRLMYLNAQWSIYNHTATTFSQYICNDSACKSCSLGWVRTTNLFLSYSISIFIILFLFFNSILGEDQRMPRKLQHNLLIDSYNDKRKVQINICFILNT